MSSWPTCWDAHCPPDLASESYVQTQEAAPTRRLFLGAGSAAAVFGAVSAAAHPSPDAELIALGRDLKAAWDFEQASLALDPDMDDEAASRLEDPGLALAERIALIPATTIQGLVVKATRLPKCETWRLYWQASSGNISNPLSRPRPQAASPGL